MRIDKDTLIRHRFWLVLGLFVPLVFASALLLYLTLGSAVADQQKIIDTAESELQHLPKPFKNDDWLPALEKRNQAAEKKKVQIWKDAWETQKAFMTWPPRIQGLADLSFGSPINGETLSNYVHPEVYLKQVEEISKTVEPWDPVKGEGLVQYNGGYEMVGSGAYMYTVPLVLHYNKITPWKELPATTEDMWLAQEDLWVQKGLLLVIKHANDSVAALHAPADASKNKNGNSFTFSNSDWKLDLAFQEGGGISLQAKLTNISSQKKMLGLSFRVYFKDQPYDPVELRVTGEPLTSNQSKEDIPAKPLRTAPTGIERVEQVLDWKSAPIKRIDRLEIGLQSHRTAFRPLLRAPVFQPAPDEAASGAKPGGPGALGGPVSSGSGGGFGSSATGGATADSDTSLNGFVRNRYTDYTETVRRLPVGMLLIVDENHIQDVLTAVANSDLRIQTTQVGWQHYRGSIQPPREEEGATPAGTTPSSTGPRSTGPRSTGFTPSPTSGGTPTAAPDEGGGNLVELAVYGIIALYQKFEAPEAAK